VPVEMVQFLMKLLLKQRILAVHNGFHWLIVATKLLTAKLHSLYVKESEILERLESGHFTYGTTTLITTSVGIFPGAAASKCCTSFSGCWRCNANGGSRNSTLSALLVCAGWASILHLLSEMHSTLPLSEILF